jgi:hypothetical protein
MRSGAKSLRFTGLKVSTTTPTPEQLAKINRFTRRPFTADELYIGQLRLANNAIDRDTERFSEGILQAFAATAIRKTLLMDHDKWESSKSAIGKFFDVETEKLAPDIAAEQTGETFRLPPDITEVMFLSPWFYIPKAGIDEKQLVKIDAGVFDFASIGFRAEALVPVSDDMGATLFYEYRGKGEMTEGSLVYLGAQHGAGVKSAVSEHDGNPNKGGKISMKSLVTKLMKAFNTVFSEDEEKLFDEIKALLDGKDTEITAHKTAITGLEAKVTELTPLAADGKAYRDGLIADYVAAKAKLNECPETPEAQGELKKVAAGYPVDFLKSEVTHLQARVAEKFPDKGQLEGDNRRDKSSDGKTKGWQEENPLIPKE